MVSYYVTWMADARPYRTSGLFLIPSFVAVKAAIYIIGMMAEEEMIFADRLFDARTKELCDIKYKTHELRRKFNAMDEYDAA